MKRHLFTALVSLSIAITPVVAAAQTAPAPLSSALTGDAKTDYESGKNLFEISDFAGAFLKFKHAFEISNEPRLLWNMAACQKELHRYARAVPLVEQYLREGGSKLTPEATQNANETLTALRALTSRVTITGAPEGTQVFADDELVGTTPAAADLSLDLGSHKLRFENPQYETFEQSVDGVSGGGRLAVTVTMTERTGAHLSILAGPGDTIAVDATVVGSERWEGTVTPGVHKIRVSAVGKTTYDANVELASRGSKTVQIALKSESKTVLWPWIVGGATLVAGAAIGGYFLFKPDKEPGSYTSGGLGTVVLPAHFGSFR